MDKNVTVRIYRVSRKNEATPRLADVLRRIDEIDGLDNRERQLATHFHVRLEFMEEETGHVLAGELTRIQTTNYPSELAGARRRALSIQNRLGHSVVFRFNHHRGILGIQYDKRVCTPGRLISYVREFDADASYILEPVVREDMWQRFDRGRPRKIQIGVASPADLAVLEGSAEAVSVALRSMGRAYHAPKITVEIAMGHARGVLGNSVKEMVQSLLNRSARGDIELDKLKAYGTDESDDKDDIDFLGEMLTFKETLELHDRDPDVNFAIKREYIRRVMHGIT